MSAPFSTSTPPAEDLGNVPSSCGGKRTSIQADEHVLSEGLRGAPPHPFGKTMKSSVSLLKRFVAVRSFQRFWSPILERRRQKALAERDEQLQRCNMGAMKGVLGQPLPSHQSHHNLRCPLCSFCADFATSGPQTGQAHHTDMPTVARSYIPSAPSRRCLKSMSSPKRLLALLTSGGGSMALAAALLQETVETGDVRPGNFW